MLARLSPMPGIVLWFLAMAAPAVSHAAQEVVPATETPRVRVDFWFGNSGDIARQVQEQCRRFNASQPSFEIVCTSQGTYPAAVQNTIAAYRVQKHPTIVQINEVATLDIMLSDAYYPVSRLMRDEGYATDWDDYFPGISSYYASSTGEMFSLPYNSSTTIFYWNKDAFARIGRDRAPETWEEAEAAFRDLKAAGYQCPFAINVSGAESWQLMEQFSAVHNEPIATRENGRAGMDAELVVDRTLFARFVADLKRWYDAELVRIKSKESGQEMTPAFASGDCQAMLTSVGDHATVGATAPQGMRWGVAKYPVYAGTERGNSVVGGASLWVLRGKSKDEYRAAAAFLHFISSPEEVTAWSRATGYIPVTRAGFSHMRESGVYDRAPFAGREVAIESLDAAPPTPLTRGLRLGAFPRIRNEFGNAMQGIFSDRLSIDEGLRQLVRRGNMALRRFEATYRGMPLP